MLGEHAQAREVCLAALALLTAEDLKFVALNLILPVELALAEAGLSNMEVADDGFMVLQDVREGVVAHLHEQPCEELISWAHARVLAAYASDETAAVAHVESLIDLNLKVVDGVRYCVAPLWARYEQQDVVVAAIVLGFRRTSPRLPAADVLGVIANHIVQSDKLPPSRISSSQLGRG